MQYNGLSLEMVQNYNGMLRKCSLEIPLQKTENTPKIKNDLHEELPTEPKRIGKLKFK